MTIAMCYLSPEGIVLGADSTSSATFDPGGFHFFNHNQKLFELGEDSTIGVLTWGLGGLGALSYRTIIANLADELVLTPASTVEEVAQRFSQSFWANYKTTLKSEWARADALKKLGAHNAADPTKAGNRTEVEEKELNDLFSGFYVGFCVAGYCLPDRTPKAYQLGFTVLMDAAPDPAAFQHTNFWGAPNMILRLMNGWDGDLRASLLSSGHWSGTEAELDQVLQKNGLAMPTLPLRDAVDFVHACIHSTIKALKFSSLSQICGGPIELAVITTDRRFRWVRHKEWDAAISEGERGYALAVIGRPSQCPTKYCRPS